MWLSEDLPGLDGVSIPAHRTPCHGSPNGEMLIEPCPPFRNRRRALGRRFAMTALPPDFTPLQGGVPIKHGEYIIGAIGVSGAKSAAQDEEVAKAGAAAVGETRTASK